MLEFEFIPHYIRDATNGPTDDDDNLPAYDETMTTLPAYSTDDLGNTQSIPPYSSDLRDSLIVSGLPNMEDYDTTELGMPSSDHHASSLEHLSDVDPTSTPTSLQIGDDPGGANHSQDIDNIVNGGGGVALPELRLAVDGPQLPAPGGQEDGMADYLGHWVHHKQVSGELQSEPPQEPGGLVPLPPHTPFRFRRGPGVRLQQPPRQCRGAPGSEGHHGDGMSRTSLTRIIITGRRREGEREGLAVGQGETRREYTGTRTTTTAPQMDTPPSPQGLPRPEVKGRSRQGLL